jgi:hypothetical protein
MMPNWLLTGEEVLDNAPFVPHLYVCYYLSEAYVRLRGEQRKAMAIRLSRGTAGLCARGDAKIYLTLVALKFLGFTSGQL